MISFKRLFGVSVLSFAIMFCGTRSITAQEQLTAFPNAVASIIKHDKEKKKDEVKKKEAPKLIDTIKVPKYLNDVSVTIRAGRAEGSGVFHVTKDKQVWIWTCGHLVKHLRTSRKNSEGKTFVDFEDAKVIKVLTENGRAVGEMNFDAEVIRYSDADIGQDLALLRIRSTEYKPLASANFYLEDEFPQIGTKLMHCGSLLGQMGSNSVTNGIVSQVGRVFPAINKNAVFDQTNATAFPGSSGGIVALETDGRYIGMLVRGAGETFSLYVPVRRMHAWAKKTGIEFAMDDSVDVPSDEELHKRNIDDSLKAEENHYDKSDDGDEGEHSYPHRLFIPKQKLPAWPDLCIPYDLK